MTVVSKVEVVIKSRPSFVLSSCFLWLNGLNFYFLVLVLMIIMTSFFVFFHKYSYSFLSYGLLPEINLCQTSSMQESQWKQIRLVERSRPANFKHHFHRWCKQITMWCKSLTLEKYISFRMKWFFSSPFLSVSSFLLLNLARRQSYAYTIGLYTRPEIKSRPDLKFVLMRSAFCHGVILVSIL